MRNIVALVMALVAATGPLAADDRDIAHAYFLRARDLAASGAVAGARELLAESLDLYPGYSETLFLSGQLDLAGQSTTGRGIGLVERALASNTWSVTPAAVARETLAYAWLRTKRFPKSLALLSALKSESYTSPEIETAYALAAAGAGNPALAEAAFEAGERLYPAHPGLALARIRFLLARKAAARAAVIVERGLKEFPEDARFVFYRLALTRSVREKAGLFDAYLAKGGADPRVVLYLLDADQALFRRAVDFSVNHQGAGDVLLLEALGKALRSDRVKRTAARALLDGSGEKTADEDGDGFWEEKYLVRDAAVERALFDWDQNGLVETEVLFRGNRPTEIVSRPADDREMRYVYNEYPRVSLVIVKEKSGSREYKIVPDRLLFRPYRVLPAPAEARLRVAAASGLRWPGEPEALRASWTLTEETAGDRRAPRRQWGLYSGRKIVLHEDADRDGTFERTVIHDAKGAPVRGLVDADGDGRAEIREVYAKGVLVRREYDADGDGTPEYSEDGRSAARTWDLDDDGEIDIRERILPDGRLDFEFLGKYRRK